MENFLTPLNLGNFRLGAIDFILLVLGHLIKGQCVLWIIFASLALKPEQGPRGIWWKSLKPGALSLYWLGVTDLTARYMGGWVEYPKKKKGAFLAFYIWVSVAKVGEKT